MPTRSSRCESTRLGRSGTLGLSGLTISVRRSSQSAMRLGSMPAMALLSPLDRALGMPDWAPASDRALVMLDWTPASGRAGIPPDRKSTRLNSSHSGLSGLSLHDALPISLGDAGTVGIDDQREEVFPECDALGVDAGDGVALSVGSSAGDA